MTDDPFHQGTTGRYAAGCRCTECRRAHADYRRERRRLLEEFTESLGPRLGNWIEQGACRDVGPVTREQFFSNNTHDIAQAKKICATCPVIDQCLDYAIESKSRYVWGGTSERARRAIRSERRASSK